MQRLAEKIAVPTTGRTVVEARDQVFSFNAMGVPVIELRLDAIRDLSVQNMNQLVVPGLRSRLLVTNRLINEAFPDRVNFGFKNGLEGNRLLYLRWFSNSADLVDLEIKSNAQLLPSAKAKVVASAHFQMMPPDDMLRLVYRDNSHGANIEAVKLCPTSNSWEDSLRFLRFTDSTARAGGMPLIAPAMNPVANGHNGGPKYYGEIVRVLTLFYGGHLTFARVGQGSAPGQMAYEDMPRLMANVEVRGLPELEKIDGEGLRQYAGKIGLRT
jgi:3-dehydroquinate dehydratase type I